MDADRRYEAPRLGSKDLITHGKSSCQSISICTGFLNPNSHRTTQSKPGYICCHSGYDRKKNLGPREFHSSIISSKAACASSRGRHCLHLPRLPAIQTYTNILEKIIWNKAILHDLGFWWIFPWVCYSISHSDWPDWQRLGPNMPTSLIQHLIKDAIIRPSSNRMRPSCRINFSCAPRVSGPSYFTNPIKHQCLLEKVRWFFLKWLGLRH